MRLLRQALRAEARRGRRRPLSLPLAAPVTPEAIMAAFGQRGPLPRAALAAAGQSREALVPVFLDRIERLTRADPDVAAGDLAFIFIYHLLAEWRETRAYRPMLRLLRSDPEMIDALMGDGITECGARLVVSLFDGDLGADRRGGARPARRGVRPRADARRAGDARPRPPAAAADGRGRPAPVSRRGGRGDARYRLVRLEHGGRRPRHGRHDAGGAPGLRGRADRSSAGALLGLRGRPGRGASRRPAAPNRAARPRSTTPSPSFPPCIASPRPTWKPKRGEPVPVATEAWLSRNAPKVGAERSLSLRQRQEVQEVLPAVS